MPSIFTIATTLLTLWLSTYIYRFARNYRYALKSNTPFFLIPWEQNHPLWMIFSVPLRPWLKRNLPTWIYSRLVLTIYGFEFTEKLRMFHEHAGGEDGMSYVMVTPGKYEFSTRDPEVAWEMLRRPRDFQQQDAISVILDRFGKNLLSSDGEEWARQRKVVATTLNERISKVIFEESVRQTEGLLEEVGEGVTGKMFDGMKKITINVLTGAGMGSSVAWKEDENERPGEGYRMSYIECVKVVIECVAGPIILPKWFLEIYPKFLPGSDLLGRLNIAVEEFPRHTWELLGKEKERMMSAHGGGESRSNIISQILKASEEVEGDKKGGKALSDDEMLGNLFIFTGAGFDTTANTLSFALVLLARQPVWQDWLFEEIDSLLPSPTTTTTTPLEYTALFPHATRILALMFETLRLFSPLVHLAKQPRSEQTITTSSGKTYWFPANATVYVNTVAIHMDSKVYRNLNLKPGETPSEDDELLFRPTRWFNDDGKTLWQAPKGSFIPWSAGPRVCPGQKMAQVEFVSIFLTMFRKFRLEAVPSREGESRQELEARLDARMQSSFPILTLQMEDVYNVVDEKKGIRVKLTARR